MIETTGYRKFSVLFWCVIGAMLTTAYVSIPNPSGRIENVVIRASFALFDTVISFFLSLFILKKIIPYYTQTGRLSASIFLFLSAVVVVISVRFSVSYYFRQRHFSASVLADNFLRARIILNSLIYDNFMLLILLPMSYSGIRFLADWYRSQTKIQRLQNERIKTELDFLKAQVNPHFLFNTLNAVYFTINEKNEKGREILLNLSEMLRYQLYECSGDRVPVSKELDYLEHYVDIEKIRRDRRYSIIFKNSAGSSLSIAPLLLLPFVENAFKHVSNYIDVENKISIKAWQEGHTLCFLVVNTYNKKNDTELKNVGIGLKNVKRRLDLLYPAKHTCTVDQSDGMYEVFLKINLA